MIRRAFLRHTIVSSIGASLLPWEVFSANAEFSQITILHTNDMHSRIDPFPMDGGRNQGMGGVVKRAAMIDEIRKEKENVLLLDAGDVFQGTPYFNFFHGEVEVKAMSEMKYDLCTIGNHDFDGGIENLAMQMGKASFTMLSSNYDFSNTAMQGVAKDYMTYEMDGVKIGVYALGIELQGLVPAELYGETQYMDPLAVAIKYEKRLRKDEKCDYVICLSHLGYKYGSEKVSDLVIAANTFETDLVIGGHTHTFMKEPDVVINQKGDRVLVNQVGFAGLMLGRIDLVFEKNKKGNCTSCQNTWLGKIV
ncbi:bifunctional metallophosphatase/5'-nucleotidase [Portibacter marinus]|uniref:bifunctional metallophosphatase/5'-nucleotidase n=1 Tax=Portibacter marinus TaxID=2898660 RepID=UPI001F32910C|nr:metallophosphatase [Portibacter marinus]